MIAFLSSVKKEWLASPFEGGSPPEFIIECSRRRVPRGSGVPIVGMSLRETEKHVIDCDCPICNMMAEGLFGPGFESLDGHHLDLEQAMPINSYGLLATRLSAWEATSWAP